MSGRIDVRLRGFADRASVERALEWVDRHAARLGAEEVAIGESAGRIPSAPLAAATDLPFVDRAGEDGYAVRSADTLGAGAYNPILLAACRGDEPLAAGSAALVAAGAALPAGADAVAGFDAAQPAGPSAEIIAAAAQGAGVGGPGPGAPPGAARPPPPGAPGPGAAHAALLAGAGLARVAVVARPRVRLVVAGAKAAAADAHAPMLRALVERDGATVEASVAEGGVRDALARAIATPGVDLVIFTGRTGTGPDDAAPVALAELGELALHGVALRPGGSVALGVAAGAPVVLLPGDPLACLCAYELIAGRFVRRLGGRDPALPHRAREAELARKIASAVGSVDVCQVRLAAGRVDPIGVAEFGGLAAAARGDGFVVVPAALEGYAQGARVTAYLH
jgi:molybdopterin molybdotransferase